MQINTAPRVAVRFGSSNDAQLDKVVTTLSDTLKVTGPSSFKGGLLETTVEFNGKKYNVTASRNPYGSKFSAVREDGNVEINYSVNSRGFAAQKTTQYSSNGQNLSTQSPQIAQKMDKLVSTIWQKATKPDAGDLDI